MPADKLVDPLLLPHRAPFVAENLVIIPTYNERDVLQPIVSAALAALPDAHVLIVDDSSPDGTGELADALVADDERVFVIHRPRKLGLGTAYLAGFRYALAHDYAVVFEMDADFSHDPRALPELLSALDQGADLALGSRYVRGGRTENWGLMRRLISRGGNVYARAVLGIATDDLTSGFKCFRREVLDAIDLDAISSEGYAFQIEMTYRALQKSFEVAEVPITFVDRREGKSKMSWAIFAEAIWVPFRLRFGR